MGSPDDCGYGIDKWVTDTTMNFKNKVLAVKNTLIRANALVIEANYLSDQINLNSKYAVELHISRDNIRPHHDYNSNIADVIITVSSINNDWSPMEMAVDDFEASLEKMRDYYTRLISKDDGIGDAEKKTKTALRTMSTNELTKKIMNIASNQRLHHLIGVSFIILKPALEQTINFSYPAPVYNNQGEVVGRLNICIRRLSDYKDLEHPCICVQIRIREGLDLPAELLNQVFCQYTFFDEVDATIVNSQQMSGSEKYKRLKYESIVMFNHKSVFHLFDKEKIARFESLAESGGTLSIQVFGHPMRRRQSSSRTISELMDEDESASIRILSSLADKWASMSSHLTLWLEIHELSDSGIWKSVALSTTGVHSFSCGGYFAIRQGQSHRLVVRVGNTRDRNSYPVRVTEITGVQAGGLRCSRLDAIGSQLDSYHDCHLQMVKDEWLDVLSWRRTHLESQLKILNQIENKSEKQMERERELLRQLSELVMERNAVEVPTPGSGIPGAPADWSPPLGMEQHVPIFYLNLSSSSDQSKDQEVVDVPIDDENDSDLFLNLPIIDRPSAGGSIVAHWDPSLHDSISLNRVTENDLFVFVVFKVTVRLSESAQCRNIVLRKRIALKVIRRTSISPNSSLFKSFINTLKTPVLSVVTPSAAQHSVTSYSCGMTYQIIAKFPSSLKQCENTQMLAKVAVEGDQLMGDDPNNEQPSWIEEYLDCTRTVNEEFKLEYERQVSAFDEILGQMKHQTRKTKSLSVATDTYRQQQPSESTELDSAKSASCEDETEEIILATECKTENSAGSDESATIVCSSETNGSCNRTYRVDDNEDDDEVHPIEMNPIHFSKRKRVRYPSVIPDWLFVGSRVLVCTNSVQNQAGNVRFVGQTDFKPGIWIGVELDAKEGRNDGRLMGRKYFECKEDHGVFVRIDKVKPEVN